MIKNINIDSQKISYKKIGAKKKIAIILIGMNSSITNYKYLADILKNKYTTYILDLNYFYKFRKIKEFSYLLNEFLKYKNIKNPLIIGHSLGGMISVDFSKKYKLDNLILINSAGYKYNLISQILNIYKIKKITPKYFLKKRPNKKLFYKMLFINNIDIFKDTKKLNTKVIIYASTKDVLFPVKIYEKIHKKLPNSKLKIVKGGHNWIFYKNEVKQFNY